MHIGLGRFYPRSNRRHSFADRRCHGRVKYAAVLEYGRRLLPARPTCGGECRGPLRVRRGHARRSRTLDVSSAAVGGHNAGGGRTARWRRLAVGGTMALLIGAAATGLVGSGVWARRRARRRRRSPRVPFDRSPSFRSTTTRSIPIERRFLRNWLGGRESNPDTVIRNAFRTSQKDSRSIVQ
jgi:hypothetical protein